mgnify:CR=1 FL=1
MYGGMEIPTNAAVFTATSRFPPGRRAANIPTNSPTAIPTTLARVPSRIVLAIASFKAGNTSRLPLIERGQLKVMKFLSQLK